MRLLLDTHALLWWWLDDPRLSSHARGLISAPGNEVLVSAASAWEIATKHRLGKLGLPASTLSRFVTLLEADDFRELPVSAVHALVAGGYSHAHRDPFDRMLAAQAEVEGLVLVSRDPVLREFGLNVVWE